MTKREAKQAVSQAVIEAQARLMAMRVHRYRSKASGVDDHAVLLDGRAPTAENEQLAHSAEAYWDPYQVFSNLPKHLGWGSHRLSQALRQSLHNQHRRQKENSEKQRHGLDWLQSLQPPTPAAAAGVTAAGSNAKGISTQNCNRRTPQSLAEITLETVKLHPDIAMGILRHKVAASGRIWLLLRWLDRTGCGWIEIEQVRKLLCEHESILKVCGWRQMRSLFTQGKGIFWNQRDGRIWLQSIPKVAQALDIERFTGRPVALPIKILTQGIGQVRAHLFASFHSGRKQASPISRRSLKKICQASPRSQQNYERRAGVRKLKNFAVGPKITNADVKDHAWQQGSACFKWRDKKAVHGAQGSSYLAWQLPNSYVGPHKQRPLGRQKQFNRELAVLFTTGITGNDQFKIDLKPKRYFDAANQAVRIQSYSQTDVYWRGRHPGLWYFMEGKKRS